MIDSLEDKFNDKTNTTEDGLPKLDTQFWDELSNELNNVGPSVKNTAGWKLVCLFVLNMSLYIIFFFTKVVRKS